MIFTVKQIDFGRIVSSLHGTFVYNKSGDPYLRNNKGNSFELRSIPGHGVITHFKLELHI